MNARRRFAGVVGAAAVVASAGLITLTALSGVPRDARFGANHFTQGLTVSEEGAKAAFGFTFFNDGPRDYRLDDVQFVAGEGLVLVESAVLEVDGGMWGVIALPPGDDAFGRERTAEWAGRESLQGALVPAGTYRTVVLVFEHSESTDGRGLWATDFTAYYSEVGGRSYRESFPEVAVCVRLPASPAPEDDLCFDEFAEAP